MSTPSPHDGSYDPFRHAEDLKMDGKYEEAIALLEQMLITDPNNVEALEEIADNELSLEHYDRAATAARSAIAIDKESFTGYYILGFVASHFERWDESVQMLRTANGLKHNNPEILRCLGWSLFNSGDNVDGVVTLERALNLDATNPLTLCDLGVVYLRMNNFAKAKALFQRALDVDPGNARAADCLQMAGRIEEHAQSGSTEPPPAIA
jgi:tetratricopeptide (TPR) repeat protein